MSDQRNSGRLAPSDAGLVLTFGYLQQIIDEQPQLDWFEIVAENLMQLRKFAIKKTYLDRVEKLAARYPIALHGVSMSIGSTDPIDIQYLDSLKNLSSILNAVCISDHLCWIGVNNKNTHELLPLPQTREALDHVCARIHFVQEHLGQPISLENPPSYVTYAHSEMSEGEFMSEMARRTGCGLLIDIDNLFISAHNNHFDPHDFLRALDPKTVTQYHLAGHLDQGRFMMDSHCAQVPPEVWQLYDAALKLIGPRSTIIEWEDRVPPFNDLRQEAILAKQRLMAATATQKKEKTGEAALAA